MLSLFSNHSANHASFIFQPIPWIPFLQLYIISSSSLDASSSIYYQIWKAKQQESLLLLLFVAAVAVLLLLLFLALRPTSSGAGHPSTTPTNGQQKGLHVFAALEKRQNVPPSSPSRRQNRQDFSFMNQKRLVPSA